MTRRAFVSLSVSIAQTDHGWQGICPKMGIVLEADDPEGLEDALHENIAMFLNTLEAHGDRESFFQRNGISLEYEVFEGEDAAQANEEVKTVAMQKDMRVLLPAGA